MKNTLPGSRLAVLALLLSVGALAYSLGVDAARHACQSRPIASTAK